MFVTSTHAHITTWGIALILFIIALILHVKGNKVGFKVTQMILRVFYILVIITGGLLFIHNQSINPAMYGVKLLGGLLVLGFMEMILIRLSKGKRTGMFWILFIIFLLIVLYLGLKLPLGFHPFY